MRATKLNKTKQEQEVYDVLFHPRSPHFNVALLDGSESCRNSPNIEMGGAGEQC